MSNDKLYMIRNAEGLFSRGGSYPKFTKRGKVWRGSGPLRSHLQCLSNANKYLGCQVVEIELKEVDLLPVTHFLELNRVAKDKRDADHKASIDKYRLEQDRKEYERLKEQFS